MALQIGPKHVAGIIIYHNLIKYKPVSDCIIYIYIYIYIYILYLVLYFRLYSKQQKCLTWKKNILTAWCSSLKKSHLHMRFELQAAVLMKIQVLWGKNVAAQRAWSPINTMSCTRRLIFSYTFLTGQQQVQIWSPSCSWSMYIDIYSASVNAFTVLVWWMHVYKFAAIMTDAQ